MSRQLPAAAACGRFSSLSLSLPLSLSLHLSPSPSLSCFPASASQASQTCYLNAQNVLVATEVAQEVDLAQQLPCALRVFEVGSRDFFNGDLRFFGAESDLHAELVCTLCDAHGAVHMIRVEN